MRSPLHITLERDGIHSLMNTFVNEETFVHVVFKPRNKIYNELRKERKKEKH
jgi:hypothetical protein